MWQKEFRKVEHQLSELIISSYGVAIGVSNGMITVKTENEIQKLPHSCNLRNLTFTNEAASISISAINWCMENKVGIDIFNRRGKHVAGIYNAEMSQVNNWKKQSEMSVEKRCQLAKLILTAKLINQLNLLKYMNKYHKHKEELEECFDKSAKIINGSIKGLKKFSSKDKDYNVKLMGFEARGAEAYWAYIRIILNNYGLQFERRENHGAIDLVNSMLNYGYAILYSRIWRSLIKYQLNPYDSVIHALQRNKPTFVYDVIEIFRAPIVDRCIISLLSKVKGLQVEEGYLTEYTRDKVSIAILNRLNKYEKYHDKEIMMTEIINNQVREIRDFIMEDKVYKPYQSKW